MQEQAPTLTPFAEGYTQALRDSLPAEHRDAPLADETLARIVEDCASQCRLDTRARNNAKAGAYWYGIRQRGNAFRLPPLTVSLGDDGRVYLREAV